MKHKIYYLFVLTFLIGLIIGFYMDNEFIVSSVLFAAIFGLLAVLNKKLKQWKKYGFYT